jgi:hypothetical protein
MASGFIILKDCRCLARRWTIYDYLIELVIDDLSYLQDSKAIEFKHWLQTLIPKENDEYNGYGGFIRQETGEDVQRWLDLRELTEENQQLFWKSLQLRLRKLITSPEKDKNDDLIWLLKYFLRMKRLTDIRDNPDNLTDWRKGHATPASAKKQVRDGNYQSPACRGWFAFCGGEFAVSFCYPTFSVGGLANLVGELPGQKIQSPG